MGKSIGESAKLRAPLALVPCAFRAFVPYVLSCFIHYVLSCPTFLRALMSNVFRALCVLMPQMPLALCVIVPPLPWALCVLMLYDLFPYLPLVPRSLVLCVLKSPFVVLNSHATLPSFRSFTTCDLLGNLVKLEQI